jgi:hypothetical protein
VAQAPLIADGVTTAKIPPNAGDDAYFRLSYGLE